MYVGTCLKGLEEISSKICKGKKILDGRIGFSKLSEYKCFDKVYKLIDKFKFRDLDDLISKIKIDDKFKVECSRSGEHVFNSIEVESAISKKVSFNEKKILFIDIIDDNCLYGELIYSDLCKRDYRVKLQAETINPCLAFCSLKLLNVKKNDIVFDPFCRDGVVLIEGSRLGCKCHGFMQNIRNARINSKVAKVDLVLDEQNIDIAKIRFKKNSVYVCSYFPSISKRKNERTIFRFYEEFFRNSFVYKKICLICRKKDVLEFAKDWKLKKELVVEKGSEKFYVFLLEKLLSSKK